MAIVTSKEVEVQCIQKKVIEEPRFFGKTSETTINIKVSAQIHKYYVLCMDDGDKTLQSMIDSINRITLEIGTKFDELALKAFRSQPEYTESTLDNSYVINKSYVIQDVPYRLIVKDDSLEIIPVYYWMYNKQSTIPCGLSNLDKGDITRYIELFIDRVKKTYSNYVRLYETREENR